MDTLKAMGAVAGIGGLALGVFLLLNRDFIRRVFESFDGITKRQAYQLLRLFLILTWSIAVIGIIAFVILELQSKSILPTPLVPTPTPTASASPAPSPTKATTVSEYAVCISEYERDCAPHNAYIYCGVDPNAVAAQACQRYKLKGPPQSRGVAKCGATLFTYICSNDVP